MMQIVSVSETPNNSQNSFRAGTTAADRAADVLWLFTSGAACLGISDVARELDLSKAVVYRIFQSFVSRDFLQFDETTRRYRLGPAAAAFGARALRDVEMRTAATPILKQLRDTTNETTTLSEYVRDCRVYLDQFESTQTIRMAVGLGTPHPLHAGSSGKAIMAFLPHDQQKRLMESGLEQLTPTTITDRQRLVDELDGITQCGFATSSGERQKDAGSVASPLFSRDGRVIGAVSICGPVGRFDHAAMMAYAKLVRDAAQTISRQVGWSGTYPAPRVFGSPSNSK